MADLHVPALLVADPSGKVLEHPRLLATVRSGEELLPPPEPGTPLPAGARLVHLPGRRPVGLDPETGELVLVSEMELGARRFVPDAVGALLPPGWTRTYLPGEVKADGPLLPQWAYTAAGWDRGEAVVWGLHTDRRTHWDPERFSTPALPRTSGWTTGRPPRSSPGSLRRTWTAALPRLPSLWQRGRPLPCSSCSSPT